MLPPHAFAAAGAAHVPLKAQSAPEMSSNSTETLE